METDCPIQCDGNWTERDSVSPALPRWRVRLLPQQHVDHVRHLLLLGRHRLPPQFFHPRLAQLLEGVCADASGQLPAADDGAGMSPPGRSGSRRRRRQVSDITVARLGVAARGPLPVAVVNGWGGVGGRVGSRAALTPAVPRGGGLRMCLPAGRAAAGPVGVGALQAVPDRGGDGPGQGCPPPPGLLFASGGAAGRAPTAVFVAGCGAMFCHGCCPP